MYSRVVISSKIAIFLLTLLYTFDLSSDFNFEPVSTYLRGGFDWHLNFFWEWLPPKDRAMRLRDPTSTFKTPAIAGGLFAINREWFLELGTYDMGTAFTLI